MRFYYTFLLSLLAGFSTLLNANSPGEEKLILSTPEEVGGQNLSSLIKDLVNPLSGHFSLRQTDLVIHGAQDIRVNRYYAPPQIPYPLHHESKDKDYWDKVSLCRTWLLGYTGWKFFPHLILKGYPKEHVIRVCDRNGITADFQVTNTKVNLFSMSYGMSNFAGNGPSGIYDPRNTQIAIQENGQKVVVNFPDGSCGIYEFNTPFTTDEVTFYLKKEILPNGKILKYNYYSGYLISIESRSPDESYLYGFLEIEGNPNFGGSYKMKSSSQDTLSYEYEIKGVETKKGKASFKGSFPPILKHVSTPTYREEQMDYSEELLLTHYERRKDLFEARYGPFGKIGSASYKIKKLLLPVDKNETFEEICSFDYDPPVAGKLKGSTTVLYSDGTKTVYQFNENLLLESVNFYDAADILKLGNKFHWAANGWLEAKEILNGNGSIISKTAYEYDKFGNPTRETLIGDLTGDGNLDTYSIKREFSQDGKNLILKEETQEGKVTLFQYLPHTNLLVSKISQEGNQILVREFYVYDQWNNLIETSIDDGKNLDPSDLQGVTQRTIKKIRLRQEAPFIHMPEWIDDLYLEDGQEQLAKRVYLTYDQWGNVCREDVYDNQGAFAYSIFRTYNERGDLLTETNPIGQKRVLEYDAKGQLVLEKKFSGKLCKTVSYDLRGHVNSEYYLGIDGEKKELTYIYDCNDNLIRKEDEYNNSTTFVYNSFIHKPVLTSYPQIVSSKSKLLSVITQSTYDSLGQELTYIDPNNNATHYTYNARGDKTEILYANGAKEVNRYFPNGKLKTHIDQDGLFISFEYDVLGRLTSKKYYKDGFLAEELFCYNSFNLISKSDKEGNITYYFYDGLGRKKSEQLCNRTIEYKYDSLGRLASTIRYNGENTLYHHLERDLLDQIITEEKTDQHGQILYRIAYGYDEDGHRQSIIRYINNEPITERFSYDTFGRLRKHTDALGYAKEMTYNLNHFNSIGQKVLQKTIIDPSNIRKIINYNALGKVEEEYVLDKDNQVVSKKVFEFEPAGNLIFENDYIYKDAEYIKTQSIICEYNNRNLVSSLTRCFGTPDARTTYFDYSLSGKISKKTLPNKTQLTYCYDPFGHLEQVTSSDGTISHKFQRNLLGNLLSAIDEINHIQIRRRLDPFGNILNETFSTGLSVEKTYDAFSRPLTLFIGGQGQVNYTYDPLFQRSITRYTTSGASRYTHHFLEYDLDGNLVKERPMEGLDIISHATDHKGRKKALNSSAFSQKMAYDCSDNLISIDEDGQVLTFSYDSLDQLISEKGPHHHNTYAYTSNFNRIEKNQEPSILNDLNELQSAGAIKCSYDLNGNLITKKTSSDTTHFSYDALNQLTEVRTGNRTIKFIYDPLGRCLIKKGEEPGSLWGTNAFVEYYLWDNQEEIGAFSENQSCKNLKILGFSHPIAIELEGKPYVPVTDIQKNIRCLIDSKNQALTYCYTSFGEQLNPNSSNPWGYAGQRFDSDLNLIYFGKRLYDPNLGRWLTPDPAGFADGTNLYQYLYNNPYRYYDPNGEFAQVVIPLIVMGAGVAAPTLGALATYAVIGFATGALAYEGYKLYESYQHNQLANELYGGYYNQENYSQQSVYKADTKEENKQKKPPYNGQNLGDDPTKCPGEGFEWRGKGNPESGRGNWYNPETKEMLHPDLNHPSPVKPHWDYHGPNFPDSRLNIDGSWEIKN